MSKCKDSVRERLCLPERKGECALVIGISRFFWHLSYKGLVGRSVVRCGGEW